MGRTLKRAFSLVELLVVIVIIAIIVGITLPALSGVRSLARKNATSTLLSDLNASITRYETDSRRMPGRFSAADMGDSSNATVGMSGMENVMLDLAGKSAIVKDVPPGGNSGDWLALRNPNGGTTEFKVNPDLIGASDGDYWKPPARNYVAQWGEAQKGGAPYTGNEGVRQLKDLVDAFGTPILAWSQDVGQAAKPISSTQPLATKDSGTPAQFYLMSNNAFLTSAALGKNGYDNASLSALGGGDDDAAENLAGFLGNPGDPQINTLTNAPSGILPSKARGRLVIHAAGVDGIFLSKKNAGRVADTDGKLHYGLTFKSAGGAPINGSDGKPTSQDLATQFDDQIVSN